MGARTIDQLKGRINDLGEDDVSDGRQVQRDIPFLGVYQWMQTGMWRTSVLHGLLTLVFLLIVGEVGADLWGLFAFGWIAAWLYRSFSDLVASYFEKGEITKHKLMAEILDVAFPVLAVLIAALLTAGGT